MLTPLESSTYERQSNIAAGLCASCTKPLKPDEIHVCQKCDAAFIECDPNGRMVDENVLGATAEIIHQGNLKAV
nr:protein NinF [uncultured Cedecea sp.]